MICWVIPKYNFSNTRKNVIQLTGTWIVKLEYRLYTMTKCEKQITHNLLKTIQQLQDQLQELLWWSLSMPCMCIFLCFVFFSFCFCLIISYRKAMLIQRIQDQGCVRKGKFATNKLLVSGNGSRKIMRPIRKISRFPLRTRMRNQVNKLCWTFPKSRYQWPNLTRHILAA